VKRTFKFIWTVAASISVGALAQEEAPVVKEVDLGSEIRGVQLNDTSIPSSVANSKLYAVHTRLVELQNRHELTVSGARTMVGDSFINSYNFGGTYTYHVFNRWSVALGGQYYLNEYNNSGKNLSSGQGVVPKIVYLKRSIDLYGTFRPFYGKVRWSLQRSIHFDLFTDAGVSQLKLNHPGSHYAALLGAGLQFWFGKHWTAKVGARDLVFKKPPQVGKGITQDLQLHLDTGWIFGG